MSMNIINKTDIESLSEYLLDIVEAQEKKTRADMKSYLNKTNLSDEQKLKEYSSFSRELFTTKITASLQTAQQYIVSDKQLEQQGQINSSQIEMNDKQIEIGEQERLATVEKVTLTKKQILQAEEETKTIKAKLWLATAETKTKLDNTVASTLSEARRNGAAITSTERTFTEPSTGQSISYQHISLAAAAATDTTNGLIGLQMLQLQNQANTFKDHSKVQIGNQIMQLASTAIADGETAITGLLSSHKTLCENVVGENIFSSTYTSIG